MPSTPTTAEIIARAIQHGIDKIEVGIPGKVHKFDLETQTVEVQPMIQRAVENGEEEEEPFGYETLPIIPDVPISFFSSGGFFVSVPIQPGTEGLIICTSRDLSQWRATGEIAPPGDNRTHTLAGAVFIPGLRAKGALMPSGGYSGAAVVLGPQVLLGDNTATEPVVLGNQYKTHTDNHLHPSPMGPTGIPTVPVPPGVLSSGVKAK